MKDKFLLVDLETAIHGSYRWAAMSVNSFSVIYCTLEGDVTNCLYTLQSHMDRRPPAPAADHCSKRSSCRIVWQGVQDPFCCFVPCPRNMEDCRHSCRGDSSAEGPLKSGVSKTSPFGDWDYQPFIPTYWFPPGLGSYGGYPERPMLPWQSSWSTWGDCAQGKATAEQHAVW